MSSNSLVTATLQDQDMGDKKGQPPQDTQKCQSEDAATEKPSKHIKQKTKGTVYASFPLDSTEPDTVRYHELLEEQHGNYLMAARSYFREKLQRRHVEVEISGDAAQICFTGGSWQELKRGMNSSAIKAELVTYLPSIISTGKCTKSSLYKQRNDDALAFYRYRKLITIDVYIVDVFVDIVERIDFNPHYSVYSMTMFRVMSSFSQIQRTKRKATSSPRL